MSISKRIVSLLPVVLMGIALAFLSPNNLKAWNPAFDLDIRFLFLVSMVVVAYVVGFKTIKTLIKQCDYQILRHLDVLMVINSIFFGYVIGVFPYQCLPFLRSYQSVFWWIFAFTTFFCAAKVYSIFKKQKTDAVLLSIC